MKLQQGQIWKLNDDYIRIVHLERLMVGYKIMKDLQTKHGQHHEVTKKEFCRLIKKASLLPPEEARKALQLSPEAPNP
jgi:hypothetical protein